MLGSGKVIETVDAYANRNRDTDRKAQGKPTVHVESKQDQDKTMQALQWRGKKSVKVTSTPKPAITDPQDVVLRITSTSICGSDLHLYLNGVPGMKSGDVMGHEFMGIVESVGPEVKNLSAGDRAVACFDIGCGGCFFCDHQLFSSCDTTNTDAVQHAMYGQKSGGFFGYSHMTGGWQGGQAEFVRVPFADLNLLKVPEGLTDDQVLFLSDILPTAWHGTELGEVHEGDVVAIWGAGPVGILTAHCAFHRGARRVILIDREAYRLEHAKSKLPGLETINYSDVKTLAALEEMTKDEPGQGPDVVIECVGFHYAKSLLHKVEMAAMLETDAGDVLNECITAVRKGGRISIIGAYVGYVNHFNIGAFMEKQLTMRGGQTPVQKYWHTLLEKVQTKQLDPTMVITHHMPLDKAAEGYKLFNDKKDNCIKVVLHPSAGAEDAARHGAGTVVQDVGQRKAAVGPNDNGPQVVAQM